MGKTSLKPAVALTLMLVSLLLSGVSFRAADPLPAQLSDEAFWQIVEDYSEDGGYFSSENFSSNELGYQPLIPKLQAFVKPGSVYMGVGPEQNFQYIAGLKPKIAFIIDIRRQNMIQHLMYKAAFEMSATRADFLSVIFSRKRPEGLSESSTPRQLFEAYYVAAKDEALAETNRKAIKDLLTKEHGFKLTKDDLETLDRVFDVFGTFGVTLNYSSNIDERGQALPGRGGANNVAYGDVIVLADDNGVNRSFLANEESFRVVKEMEEKNLLIPLVGNFGGPKAIRAVGTYLKQHGAIVGAFYVSNVEQYLFRPQGPAPLYREFYENVGTLPLDDSSTFIRSGQPPNRARNGGLTPMMSSILEVLAEFKAGRVNTQSDVLRLSTD